MSCNKLFAYYAITCIWPWHGAKQGHSKTDLTTH